MAISAKDLNISFQLRSKREINMFWLEEGIEIFQMEDDTQMEGCIVDFPYDIELQAEMIEYFIEEDDIILFWWVEPNEEDYKRCPQFHPNPWEGIKECKFMVERQQKGTTEKNFHKIYFYSIDSHEELINVIKRKGIILAFYIIKKECHVNDYKYFLHTYEHHIFNEDGQHHRSLFCESKGVNNFHETELPKIKSCIDKYYIF
jgi:hypothetical protein